METFSEFVILSESIINIQTVKDKNKYAQEVYRLLVESYSDIGGVKGNGFNSVQDMISNIPLWKILKSNNKIIAVLLYKDKEGRKLVALVTDKSIQAKHYLLSVLSSEFKRSYFEVSHGLKKFIQTKLPKLYSKYLIKVDDAIKTGLIPADAIKINDYEYSRNIGGVTVNKVILGTPNIPLK